MLRVYFTVDVEVWCDGWDDLDSKFSDSFQRYIYGPTPQGDYGLPYQLKLLNEYGIQGVFFVEPLFSLRFGKAPLVEIVEMLQGAGQSVEMHLHTEWVDEIAQPIFPDVRKKRQYLRNFTLDEQRVLIEIGKDCLQQAGVNQINSFRAGSFGFNAETLPALRDNNILIDSSYNALRMGLTSGVMPGHIISESICIDGIHEVPMTVYYDRPGHLRHTQLCACSTQELEGVLWKALEAERSEVVILSHSFELLDRQCRRPNKMVIKRFQKLCEFLHRNEDSFSTEVFSGFVPRVSPQITPPLSSPMWKTGLRIIEQAWGRFA